MLASLAIRDVVLIDRLDLAFAPGLTVLTGETGAGKSILLDALGLAIGQRGDAGLVRHGASQASVTAVFEIPDRHEARRIAAEHGIADDGGPLILRRTLGSDGRSRAFVNDEPASVGLLRRLGASLVEIEGQFESQGLLDAATHRRLLDAFAGAGARVAETASAAARWSEARRLKAEAEAEIARARADEDFLRHALSELDAFDPKPGEEAELAELRQRLMNREKIAEAISVAEEEIGGARGAERAINAARRALDRIAGKAGASLNAAAAALDRGAAELAEAVAGLRSAAAEADIDPRRLAEAEERLFGLRELARKHRVEVDALPALKDAFAARLSALDDQGGLLARRAEEEAGARSAYVAAAEALSAARKDAAKRLDKAVNAELKGLKLEKAKFRTELARLPEEQWGEAGIDSVAFQIATNPGAPFAPLARIASGGELARLMLAVTVCLARANPVPSLVFDEVDAGVGGATAAAVGERLQRLAEGLQVLVVTHSPQVAAMGRQHWRVSKETAAGTARTRLLALDPDARREEIARMLSAAEVTAEARAQADRLLAAAEAAA
jgi:DNA repair protein RecN (Recombination protein N)